MSVEALRDADLELVAAINIRGRLSSWETDVVADLLKRLRRERTAVLTIRQRDVAEQIRRRLAGEPWRGGAA